MDKDKLERAISHLRNLYSITDNLLYHNHSKESLKKELKEIDESISFLESLKEDEP